MASALQGCGVVETFHALVQQVYDHIDARCRLREVHGLERDDFVRKLTTEVEA